jgi:hypothetical protein
MLIKPRTEWLRVWLPIWLLILFIADRINIGSCHIFGKSSAGVAQLVEQFIRNEEVGGSTPLSGTTIIEKTSY